MIHIIYTYKDNVYETYKKWDFMHAEDVLKRLGASYWEIGIDDNRLPSYIVNKPLIGGIKDPSKHFKLTRLDDER